jgi:hypothetical protein
MPRENKRHHQHRGAGEQFDLFRLPGSGSTQQPPAWEALPPQTRATQAELRQHPPDNREPDLRRVRRSCP